MPNTLSMDAVFTTLRKWLRPIIAFVALATLAGALATLVLPRKYLSAATIVPADPALTDKAYLYGTHVMELKSVYGKEEDLDRLLATAQLDGNLNFLADSFKLTQHYNIGGTAEKARYKSFRTLKKNVSVFKTETGTVKLQVWDTDKQLAAAMANAWVNRVENTLREHNKKAIAAYLQQVETNIERKSAEYRKNGQAPAENLSPADQELKAAGRRALLAEIEEEMKMQAQLKTAMEAESPALVVLEKAYAADTPDKPKPFLWIAAAFLGSLFFAVLLALVAESFKKNR